MPIYLIEYKSYTYVEAENKADVIALCEELDFDSYKIIEED